MTLPYHLPHKGEKMYAYKDKNSGYIAEGFDFRYWFATAVEVERFASAMHLPINWL